MLTLYNLKLSSNNVEVSEMLVQLDQLKVEQKEKKETEEKEIENQNKRQVQTHRAYNQDRETRKADFNEKLNEIFEKNSAKQVNSEDEDSEGDEGNYSLSRKNSKKEKERSDGNNTSEEISQKSAAYDYSSISFSLKDRNAVDIPNPVYTCDTRGKIVVNISVDANGYVIDTDINKASSSTTNECLTEQALKYAAEARFSKMSNRKSQPGTITYYFKS